MSKEIKIATPDAATVKKVEFFIRDVNQQIGKYLDDYEQSKKTLRDSVDGKSESESIITRKIEKPETCVGTIALIVPCLFVLFVFALIEAFAVNSFSSSGSKTISLTLCFLCSGLIGFLFCCVTIEKQSKKQLDQKLKQQKQEKEKNCRNVTGKDIEKLLNNLADTYSLRCSWKGVQMNKAGKIVTDWDTAFEGYPVNKPEDLIQTILCDGILFINSMYWLPIPPFPDEDTGSKKAATMNQEADSYIALHKSWIPLKKIPLDPDTDELSILQKDHANGKFLSVEADEETINDLVSRLSR